MFVWVHSLQFITQYVSYPRHSLSFDDVLVCAVIFVFRIDKIIFNSASSNNWFASGIFLFYFVFHLGFDRLCSHNGIVFVRNERGCSINANNTTTKYIFIQFVKILKYLLCRRRQVERQTRKQTTTQKFNYSQNTALTYKQCLAYLERSYSTFNLASADVRMHICSHSKRVSGDMTQGRCIKVVKIP